MEVVSDCLTFVNSLRKSVLGWLPRGDRRFSLCFAAELGIFALGLGYGIRTGRYFTIPESLTGIGFAAILPRDWD
jgi:hypothetical protein